MNHTRQFKISYERPTEHLRYGLTFVTAPDEATAIEQFKKRVPNAVITAIVVAETVRL